MGHQNIVCGAWMRASTSFPWSYSCSSHQFLARFWYLLVSIYSSHILIDPKVELAKLIVLSARDGGNGIHYPWNFHGHDALTIWTSANHVNCNHQHTSVSANSFSLELGWILFLFFLAKLDVILEPFHVLLCKLQGSPAAVSWRVTGNVMALQLVFVKRSLLLIRVSALLAVQGSTLSRELPGEPAGLWGMRRGLPSPSCSKNRDMFRPNLWRWRREQAELVPVVFAAVGVGCDRGFCFRQRQGTVSRRTLSTTPIEASFAAHTDKTQK